MDMTEQDARHYTRALAREQCYLCIMSLVETPPAAAPPQERLRAEHKKFLAELEEKGILFGSGKLGNEAEGEKTELGYGMMIIRAESRAAAERIAFEEPFTKHGYRTMAIHPWQRTEGDLTLRLSLTNGTLTLDRRSYKLT